MFYVARGGALVGGQSSGEGGDKNVMASEGGKVFFLKKSDDIISETKGKSSSCSHRLFKATQM